MGPDSRVHGRRLACVRAAQALIVLLGLLGAATAQAETLRETGKVQISQVQVAFLYSGNLGGGTLSYGGRRYDFEVGGLGIGGIGASRIEATGEVYNLDNLADFEGAYVQARYGAAIVQKSTGELWLQNADGVLIRLDAQRRGLALSLGADAVYIRLD